MLLFQKLCMVFAACLCFYAPPDTAPKTPPNPAAQATSKQAPIDKGGKLPGKFAKLRPLVVLPLKALPSPLRSGIPAQNEYGGAVHEGAFWFVWYRPAAQLDPNGGGFETLPWRMETWRQEKANSKSGNAKSAGLQPLSTVTLDEGIDAPLTSGLADDDLSLTERAVDNGMA